MKNLTEKIKTIFLYSGCADKEEYHKILPEIQRTNFSALKMATGIANVFLVIMFLISFAGVMPEHVYIYGGFAIFNTFFYLVLRIISQKGEKFSFLMVYLYISIIYLFGIVIGTSGNNDGSTVTFIIMLLILPLLFIDRLIKVILTTLIGSTIFLLLDYQMKAPEVFKVDLLNVIIYSLLGICLSYNIMKIHIGKLIAHIQVRFISETELLTGLKNRNAYEQNLLEYPKRCRRNIACLYIDVNGLHEINNAFGHVSGDEMLCSVAKELQRQFGQNDSYRIGGDEYVAFAIDVEIEEVTQRIAYLQRALEEDGYHISLGMEIMYCNELDMSTLVKLAELKMYQAKAAYYQGNEGLRRFERNLLFSDMDKLRLR